MELDKIIYPLITAIIGFFLRDIYALIKKKLIKTKRPKLSVKYDYGIFLAYGGDPRIYTYKSKLIIQNIDIIPIYEIEIFKSTNSDASKNLYYTQELLGPTEKIIKEEEEIVKYGDGFNHPEEAEKLLPKIFSEPKILIQYKNITGNKFDLFWEKIN